MGVVDGRGGKTNVRPPNGHLTRLEAKKPRSRPIGEKITKWTHTGACDQLDSSAKANAASIGIVTVVTGLNPCDIFGVAFVTAADERLVAAINDRHLAAIFKVALAAGIGGGS
jgi:hypothetical protein